jgi:hypothetical protein
VPLTIFLSYERLCPRFRELLAQTALFETQLLNIVQYQTSNPSPSYRSLSCATGNLSRTWLRGKIGSFPEIRPLLATVATVCVVIRGYGLLDKNYRHPLYRARLSASAYCREIKRFDTSYNMALGTGRCPFNICAALRSADLSSKFIPRAFE